MDIQNQASYYTTPKSLPQLAWNASDFTDKIESLSRLAQNNAQGVGQGAFEQAQAAQRVDASASASNSALPSISGQANSATFDGLPKDDGGSYRQWLRSMEAKMGQEGFGEENKDKGETSTVIAKDPATGLLKRTVKVDDTVVSESILPDTQQPTKIAEREQEEKARRA